MIEFNQSFFLGLSFGIYFMFIAGLITIEGKPRREKMDNFRDKEFWESQRSNGAEMKKKISKSHWINMTNSSGCEVQLWNRKYTIWLSNKDFKEAEKDAEALIAALEFTAAQEESGAAIKELVEALRKCTTWADAIALRIDGEERKSINWNYLNMAKAVFEKHRAK